MSQLNQHAVDVLTAYGITVQEWTAHVFDPHEWGGDACGCPDDRCIGYHHDRADDCQCLPTLIAPYLRNRAHQAAVDAVVGLTAGQAREFAAHVAMWAHVADRTGLLPSTPLVAGNRPGHHGNSPEPTPSGFLCNPRTDPAAAVHAWAGWSADRAGRDLPGHCADCAAVGHLLAHPGVSCADVSCRVGHPMDGCPYCPASSRAHYGWHGACPASGAARVVSNATGGGGDITHNTSGDTAATGSRPQAGPSDPTGPDTTTTQEDTVKFAPRTGHTMGPGTGSAITPEQRADRARKLRANASWSTTDRGTALQGGANTRKRDK